MNGFTKQELTACGFFSSLFGSKPAENAWKELNNILADAASAQELDAAKVKKVLQNWGVKFNEENNNQRSALYRKLADTVYTEALTADDALFAEAAHLAEVLQLPDNLVKLANKGAKTTAYFARCKKILEHTEKLAIGEINKLFGYDYEDGLAIRRQVFQSHFNLQFEEISKNKRYSPEQEESLRRDCADLDIPYEFKNNIANALEHYRQLWEAENADLGDIPVELPLREGEICRAYANAGACEQKTIEREDNLLEVTRRFEIDETVTFEGEKLKHPKLQEEVTAVNSIGYFFLTSQRLIYLTQKDAQLTELADVTGADFDGINIITFHTRQGGLLYKYSDEAAEAMYIIFGRVFREFKDKK